MREAYLIGKEKSLKAALHGRQQFDKRVICTVQQPGDKVLLRNLSTREEGPGKLRSYWEQEIYEVIKRHRDDSTVYIIKPLQGEGKSKTVYRKLLPPCPFLQLESTANGSQKAMEGKTKQKRNRIKGMEEVCRSTDQESDSENDMLSLEPNDYSNYLQSLEPNKERARRVHTLPLEDEELAKDDHMIGEDEASTNANGPVQQQEDEVNEKDHDMTEQSPPNVKHYPRRVRNRRPIFMYNRLGEPNYYVHQVQNPMLYRNQVAVQTPVVIQPAPIPYNPMDWKGFREGQPVQGVPVY